MVTLETATLRRWIEALPTTFEANLEQLNALDARAGDGDHGTTMLRGLQAAAKALEGLSGSLDARLILKTAGLAFRRAAGGASGPLFSSLLLELAKMAQEDGLDLAGLVTGLTNTISSVIKLGKAQAGDRTMLDALIPATEAARAATALKAALEAAVQSAGLGVTATATMVAQKGRARNVNAGRVESPDAGATSVQLMLETLQHTVEAS